MSIQPKDMEKDLSKITPACAVFPVQCIYIVMAIAAIWHKLCIKTDTHTWTIIIKSS